MAAAGRVVEPASEEAIEAAVLAVSARMGMLPLSAAAVDQEDTPPTSAAAASASSPSASASSTLAGERRSVACLMIGMAGSGKTSLLHALSAHLRATGRSPYVINADPAVAHVPYACNIDIRDSVNYKEVMKRYGLGPNGGIMTSLNLFSTRFEEVMVLLRKRADEASHVLMDTPGQIEVFTWSASGQIITESLASEMPTCIIYVIDTPRTTAPTTFMSNMLYACSILYKTRLPFVIALNKSDVQDPSFALEWMRDFEAFHAALDADTDKTYASTLTRSMALVLDEFYASLTAVSVSAATGTGMEALVTAIHHAVRDAAEDRRRIDKAQLADLDREPDPAIMDTVAELRQQQEDDDNHDGDDDDDPDEAGSALGVRANGRWQKST